MSSNISLEKDVPAKPVSKLNTFLEALKAVKIESFFRPFSGLPGQVMSGLQTQTSKSYSSS